MTQKDNELMKVFGITTEAKSVYYFDNYKYDNLSDAIQYAKNKMKNSPLKDIFDNNNGERCDL